MRRIRILFSYTFWRLFNAGAILISATVSALIVGAEEWSRAGLIQTIFSYLVFLSLGINEGLGQKIATNRHYYELVYQRLRNTLIILTIIIFSIYVIFIKLEIMLLLYICGTSSLLLFMLNRLYYRGIGSLNGLSYLYMCNGVIILISPLLVQFTNSSFLYIYLLIIASVISALFVGFKIDRNVPKTNLDNDIKRKFSLSKLKRLIHIGFPIMLSGLIFEIIITFDRFYINQYYDKSNVGNISLSLLIVKGAIMGMSIMTTYTFKMFSKYVTQRDIINIKLLYKRYCMIGLLGSITFIVIVYLIISSKFFEVNFPSYQQLSNVFVFQSLILFPLVFIFPLGIISNFRYGGKVYLSGQIFTLLLYLTIIYIFELFQNVLNQKQLSLIVFCCFSLSAICLNKYVFRRFLK